MNKNRERELERELEYRELELESVNVKGVNVILQSRLRTLYNVAKRLRSAVTINQFVLRI